MENKHPHGEREPEVVEGDEDTAPERDESVNEDLAQEERPTTSRP
jgi:hypothetical protein